MDDKLKDPVVVRVNTAAVLDVDAYPKNVTFYRSLQFLFLLLKNVLWVQFPNPLR